MELKTLPLPLTVDYTNYWEFEHGIRELLSNMLDGAGHVRENYSIQIGEDWVSFKNSSTSLLSHSSIAMGSSNSRTEEENIGQFGEGMKMAWLLMLRHGATVTIFNGDHEKWTAAFRHSTDFCTEIIHVDIETFAEPQEQPTYNIEVRVGSLSQEMLDRVRDYLESTLIDPATIRGYVPATIELSPVLSISLDARDAGTVFVEKIPVSTMGLLPVGVMLQGHSVNLSRDRDNVGIDTMQITRSVVDGLLQNGKLNSVLLSLATQHGTANSVATRCDRWHRYVRPAEAIQFLTDMENPLVDLSAYKGDEDTAVAFIRQMGAKVDEFYKFLVDYYKLSPKTLFVESDDQVEYNKRYSPGWDVIKQPAELHQLLRNALAACKGSLSDEELAQIEKQRTKISDDARTPPKDHLTALLASLKTIPGEGTQDTRLEEAIATIEKLALLAKRWWMY